MDEIEFIKKLDAAVDDGPAVNVSDRVLRRIRITKAQASDSGPMWIAALVSTLAATAVLLLAIQSFSSLQDPFGDLLTPLWTTFAMSAIPPLPTTLPPRPRRWLRIFVSLLIFFGGMVCGGGLTVIVAVRNIRHVMHHPEEVPLRITRYLTRRLDLSADQSDKVQTLIAQHQMHLQAIRRETQPRVAKELADLREEIGQVLNPNQKLKWDDIFDETLDRWMPLPPPAATQPF
jgi:hypothetical protein